MAGITERNRQKDELTSIGFSMKYIDTWQPKTTLYLHKESYYAGGGIAADIGTAVAGVPGNPEYELKKSKIGLFPWPPSEACTCKWCVERKGTQDTVEVSVEGIEPPSVSTEQPSQRGTKRFGPHYRPS